jgi:metal-sulfur cluster biosynthetic enzyme
VRKAAGAGLCPAGGKLRRGNERTPSSYAGSTGARRITCVRKEGVHGGTRVPPCLRWYARNVEQPSREQITDALGKVIDPELKRPVTELDMVRDVRVEDGHVAVTIALTVAGCPLRASFEDQVRTHMLPLPGVESVSLEFDVMSPDERAALTQRLRGAVTGRSQGISVDASTRVLARAASASRRFPSTSRRRSTGSDSGRASSTPTSTATRSRTCSASPSGPSSSTR